MRTYEILDSFFNLNNSTSLSKEQKKMILSSKEKKEAIICAIKDSNDNFEMILQFITLGVDAYIMSKQIREIIRNDLEMIRKILVLTNGKIAAQIFIEIRGVLNARANKKDLIEEFLTLGVSDYILWPAIEEFLKDQEYDIDAIQRLHPYGVGIWLFQRIVPFDHPSYMQLQELYK